MAVTDRDKLKTSVLINVSTLPDTGTSQLLIRLTPQDMRTVEAAAHVLWLKRSDFARVAIVRAAEKIIAENT